MDEKKVGQLLAGLQDGKYSLDQCLNKLKMLDNQDLDHVCLDHHRALRTGRPEVIFGENKEAAKIREIIEAMLARSGLIMATRVSATKAKVICHGLPEVSYYPEAKMVIARPLPLDNQAKLGKIVVICAGTSDLPVAKEAQLTAWAFGNEVVEIHDVGVAGIHRLYEKMTIIYEAKVIIVVAGMEGALPSVVAGLVSCPVVAVPTSIGYGASFGGVAALLGMLNSCSSGLAVVNIDNGFGAACMADSINSLAI